jgi:hypothetical protein
MIITTKGPHPVPNPGKPPPPMRPQPKPLPPQPRPTPHPVRPNRTSARDLEFRARWCLLTGLVLILAGGLGLILMGPQG